jgi:hypothetical protein
MIGFVKFSKDDKDRIVYRCSGCGAVISHSGLIIEINGAKEHSFVNPSGIRCDFITFSHCENSTAHPELYLEYSWFSGYGWRFLTCEACSRHLGWQYDATGGRKSPGSFFGVLANAVTAGQGGGP